MNKEMDDNAYGYAFHDRSLLKNALTHSSYINENKLNYADNNERLEFLGDAIFDAVISDYLYHQMEKREEGDLTKIRSAIVCEPSLVEQAMRLGIGSNLILGKGEEGTGGRQRSSILADAMEAIIGAIYLDGGYLAAQDFIMNTFRETIEKAVNGLLYSDFKTEVQELLQTKGEADIQYLIEKEEGPDHNKIFYTRLICNGVDIGRGSGRSKKESEQQAAKDALENLKR